MENTLREICTAIGVSRRVVQGYEKLNLVTPTGKEAMDSYEAFYDEYCEFMKKYQENPTDLELLAEYADMVGKLAEMDENFQKWEDADLNDEELKYYMEVNTRVSQKMLEIL